MYKAKIIRWINPSKALVVCLECGKEFEKYKQRLEIGSGMFCGQPCANKSPIRSRNISITHTNEQSGRWKGDKCGLVALHTWVRRRKQKPLLCEECKIISPVDLANISQEYKRDVNDFEWLCRKCHMVKDGRMDKNLYLGSFLVKRKKGMFKNRKKRIEVKKCGKL